MRPVRSGHASVLGDRAPDTVKPGDRVEVIDETHPLYGHFGTFVCVWQERQESFRDGDVIDINPINLLVLMEGEDGTDGIVEFNPFQLEYVPPSASIWENLAWQ